uniref:Uncharacterized protein n=1 Tax=Tanacetum cinerariifolium TaxID=118510 RepID=A0A6L2JB20_TANCI|nr:hypothetical protein [Tanacetum cinerariifolium]
MGGFTDKFVRDPNKTTDSSQRPPQDCPKCENPVDGLYFRHCALLRKKLKEVWFIICDEHKFFQDFLNTFESSNDDSNVVNEPQEPIVFNQDPGENSSQSPPQIYHQCCYGCCDSLDDIQRCTCESCGKGAHYGYNCSPKVPIISNPELCHNQNVDEFPQTLPSFHPTCYSGDENSFAYDSTPDFVNDSSNDKFIKSSVENLVPNPSESEDERECDMPVCDDFTTFSNLLFDADDDLSSSDDKSFFDEDIPKEIYSNPIFDEEIHLIEKLFDPFMEEIDLFLTSDGSIPLGIDSYSDSEGDNLFPERLLHDDPIPLLDILDFSNVF